MGDKTDDKNESSHEMKDNDDDPSHMGDDNHQHDEHDDKDDDAQAIATYTQAQLASLVQQAVSNAISQERTDFHSHITRLETFHNEEVDNVRNDFKTTTTGGHERRTRGNTSQNPFLYPPHQTPTRRRLRTTYSRVARPT